MNPLKSIIVTVGFLVISPLAIAQQPMTVAELLNKGGIKLTKEGVLKIFSGVTLNDIQHQAPYVTYQEKFLPGGKLTGTAKFPKGGSTTFLGTWNALETGQICVDWTNAEGYRSGGCSYYYSLGNKYYRAKLDGGQSTVEEVGQFTR